MCKLLRKDEEFKWIEACNKILRVDDNIYDMFANVNGTKLKNQISCAYQRIKLCTKGYVRSKPK